MDGVVGGARYCGVVSGDGCLCLGLAQSMAPTSASQAAETAMGNMELM